MSYLHTCIVSLEKAIFKSGEIKDQHETAKLLNEESRMFQQNHLKPSQQWVGQLNAWQTLVSDWSCLLILTNYKVEVFHVLNDEFALLMRRCSAHGASDWDQAFLEIFWMRCKPNCGVNQ